MFNQDQFKNQWNKFRGVVQENFDELTAEDISAINGKRDVLISKIQARYGVSKNEAEEQLSEIETTSFGPAQRGLNDSGFTPKNASGVKGANPASGAFGSKPNASKDFPKDKKSHR